MRAIEEAENEEIDLKNRSDKDAEEEIRLSMCFVEYLDGYQLFDSLFLGDDTIKILLSVDGTAELLKT